MIYTKDSFPEPECPNGYPWHQLEEILDKETFKNFSHWMAGQTCMICEGRKYNHQTREYEPDECSNNPHGGVAYRYDVLRFFGFLGKYHQSLWD